MSKLVEDIRAAIAAGRYVFEGHARERCAARHVESWQVAAGVADGRVLKVRPNDVPFPAVEFDITLADGTAVKCVWSWINGQRAAKLVTVHFYDKPRKR